MARFSDRMVTEVVQPFWAAMQRGESSPTLPPRPVRIARRELAGWWRRAGCVPFAAAI
jgi:hypothetical protein